MATEALQGAPPSDFCLYPSGCFYPQGKWEVVFHMDTLLGIWKERLCGNLWQRCLNGLHMTYGFPLPLVMESPPYLSTANLTLAAGH